MTTVLIYGEKSSDVEKVLHVLTLALYDKFTKHNVKPSKVWKSRQYGNFAARITVNVPEELVGIAIPKGFYDQKTPKIELKEVKG